MRPLSTPTRGRRLPAHFSYLLAPELRGGRIVSPKGSDSLLAAPGHVANLKVAFLLGQMRWSPVLPGPMVRERKREREHAGAMGHVAMRFVDHIGAIQRKETTTLIYNSVK